MLTATYSIVAISTEQSKTRRILHKLQQYVQNTWKSLQTIDLSGIESAFHKLAQFDKYCRNRKVEVHLIPAVRSATSEADPLLAELERLSATGMNILRTLREQLGRALEQGGTRCNELCDSMELYCHNLQKRLAKEEEELFPLVRRLFSVEEWFDIAAKFLSDEAETRGGKRHARSSPSATHLTYRAVAH